jgi:hypothetical protein
VSWALESSGAFSSHLLYLKLNQGASFAHAKDIGELSTLPKLKIFIWQLARGHLPSSEQIKKTPWPI